MITAYSLTTKAREQYFIAEQLAAYDELRAGHFIVAALQLEGTSTHKSLKKLGLDYDKSRLVMAQSRHADQPANVKTTVEFAARLADNDRIASIGTFHLTLSALIWAGSVVEAMLEHASTLPIKPTLLDVFREFGAWPPV